MQSCEDRSFSRASRQTGSVIVPSTRIDRNVGLRGVQRWRLNSAHMSLRSGDPKCRDRHNNPGDQDEPKQKLDPLLISNANPATVCCNTPVLATATALRMALGSDGCSSQHSFLSEAGLRRMN